MSIRTRGFTLIELLMVIVVIMILAGVLLPALFHAKALGKKRQTQTWVKCLETGIRNYHFQHRTWPCPDDQQGKTDLTYANNNYVVINMLTNSVPPMLDLGNFRRAANGSVVDAKDGYLNILMDTDYNGSPADGVRVTSTNY